MSCSALMSTSTKCATQPHESKSNFLIQMISSSRKSHNRTVELSMCFFYKNKRKFPCFLHLFLSSTAVLCLLSVRFVTFRNRTPVKYSRHDPNLQLQHAFLGSYSARVFPWMAFCDERSSGYTKTMTILVLTENPMTQFVDELVSKVSCQDPNNKHFYNYSRVFVPLFRQNHGFVLFCPFERNLECPETVAMKFKDSETTNLLNVERHDLGRSKKETTKPSFALCLPPISTSFQNYRIHGVQQTHWHFKSYPAFFRPYVLQNGGQYKARTSFAVL